MSFKDLSSAMKRKTDATPKADAKSATAGQPLQQQPATAHADPSKPARPEAKPVAPAPAPAKS